MMEKLNVKEVLRSSGWFEGRKIDTARLERHYRAYGYVVFPAVLKFIKEFGVLQIVIEKSDAQVEWHHTDPELVVGDYYRHGRFKVEESYAGEKLIPVGEACNENLLLFVSESGKIYHSNGKLGDNAWKAWEALVNHIGFKDWGDLQRERV
jgi:hypothetical protein